MGFWPDNYQGAISISFDDGMQSQLGFAVPALNERGIKATFYLNPRGIDDDILSEGSWQERLEPWAAVQKMGHEIGNHSLMHPCSLNIKADWLEGRNLLEWDLARIEADILEAQRRIKIVFPAQQYTSYAYPCYESTVGKGEHRQSYVPIVARNFIAARANGELRGELANDPRYCDLHHLSSWPVERQQGAFMVGLVEQAVAAGLWGIFTIHGIHESHLPIGGSDFIELVDHLARRQAAVWVAPVAEIGAYIHQKLA
jgi:peptidoglycan-N-acetylglucosamine deacetylase